MEPGTKLGPYEIKEPLGKGGMGEVYRAHDTNLRRDVAIKLLPEELSNDEQRLARLWREARSLAALNHPHIAHVYGFEERGGASFIVMELVEGETLAERLEGGPLPVEDSLDFAVQIARALEAAHERGIVHRDLKPSNVKITPSGDAKVLDFGLAKPVRAETADSESELPTATVEATRIGTVLGTAPYMSPEQVRGEEVDERTDIWAFGCLLYEMLTGRAAFAAATSSETLATVLRDEVNWSAFPADVPVPVRRLLRRTLRKDPDRRLHHIGDARLEIEDALETCRGVPRRRGLRQDAAGGADADERLRASTDAGRAGAPAASSTSRPLRLAPLLFLVVVGAVFFGAAGWYLWSTGQPEITDRSIAVLPFETLGQEETTSFTDGVHGDMLTRLSNLSGLQVTSRTSVMRYRRPDRPLSEIAEQLGVAWVLLGEVQESGDRVKVNARLVNARQDRQVWADSYQRELTAENLFQIQAELTETIAEQLQARLTPEDREAVERTPTEDLQAYRLYVQGRSHLEQRTEAALRRAVEHFQQAIARDPDYALAWAGLADALVLFEWYAYEPPKSTRSPERAVGRALELGPDLAEARTSLGILRSVRYDGPAAVRELERAIEIRPSYAEASIWLAWVQLKLGRPAEALKRAKRAMELDPLSPVHRAFLADTHLANGEWPEALRQARRGVELQSDYGLARYMEALALYHLGRLEEAESALRDVLSLVSPQGSPSHAEVHALRGLIHAGSGDTATARDLLARIDDEDAPFSAGLVYAALGETAEAFDRFLHVDRWGSFSVEYFRYLLPEVLGPLRGDPRYERILRQANRKWGLNPDGSFPATGESEDSRIS